MSNDAYWFTYIIIRITMLLWILFVLLYSLAFTVQSSSIIRYMLLPCLPQRQSMSRVWYYSLNKSRQFALSPQLCGSLPDSILSQHNKSCKVCLQAIWIISCLVPHYLVFLLMYMYDCSTFRWLILWAGKFGSPGYVYKIGCHFLNASHQTWMLSSFPQLS